MSECYSARCQQDRKMIRQGFNKWQKNLLLQIGLETISKNHLDYDINLLNDEQISTDFDPDQPCLFCTNRQQYSSSHDDCDQSVKNEETSPLDLSIKSTSNINSQSLFDVKSDIFPMYTPEEFFLLNPMNYDYLFPNMNLINQYPLNSLSPSAFEDNYMIQLAKQMAYLRMIQELEYQRNNKISDDGINNLNSTSMNVNHIINDIMMRTLNEIFEEQTNVSKQNNDKTIFHSKTEQKNNNQINSSTSIHTKPKNKSQSNPSSSQKSREINSNSKIIVGIDGKQVRSKRGHYRRYESEQLSKAVAAVLSNQMSVHKAGSYFGVPHSTLEYKVKERNSKLVTTMKNKHEISSSI